MSQDEAAAAAREAAERAERAAERAREAAERAGKDGVEQFRGADLSGNQGIGSGSAD